jgi:hypothetical protein
MVKYQDPDLGSGSGMLIRDEHPVYIFENLETIFGLKILKFFYVDPGSGIFLTLDPASDIRDGKIRVQDKHPGSATLV